ncbi:hypothetical protein U5A82_15435 [Sphingobium sp. CR2-8]|uniref:hypothetical protein n=1 Tax=Sphingobium sp. CR2-8 TaxID=1306534 RepID=UPI002DBD43FB|nr:hypothetical protein [Sphingobium sp. CR2-8]MEC3911810.1 hypothetical protein [Sphingobium sp. CR2-8]
MTTFWKWLQAGAGKAPAGCRNIVNLWLALHALVALAATYFVATDPFSFASKALFPASSVLIGMSMAWTTRASTVLQTKDLRDALFNDERPAEDYVYGFQLSILIVMIMVGYVAVMAGGGLRITVLGRHWDHLVSGYCMYFIISLALRECWGVVNFTNMLSMLEYRRSK